MDVIAGQSPLSKIPCPFHRTKAFIEPALRLMGSRQADTTVLIAEELKLDDALRAIEHAAEPGVLKVLIEA